MAESHVRLARARERGEARRRACRRRRSGDDRVETDGRPSRPEHFAHASRGGQARHSARFGVGRRGRHIRPTGSLVVSGTAAQIEDAFRAGSRAVRPRPPTESSVGAKATSSIPADLDGVVTGVFGLDQRRVARRLHAAAAGGSDAGSGPSPIRSGPRNSSSATASPTDEAKDRRSRSPSSGAATSQTTCARSARRTAATVPQIETVSVGLRPPTPPADRSAVGRQQAAAGGESHEVMMDVEIVAGLCDEREDLRTVFAPFDQKGWIDLLDRVVAADPPPVTLERQLGLGGGFRELVARRRVDAINQRLQAASLRGITVCAATGDDGSGDQMHDERAHVHFPASSPVRARGRRHDARGRSRGRVVESTRAITASRTVARPEEASVSAFKRPSWQNVRTFARSTPADRRADRS